MANRSPNRRVAQLSDLRAQLERMSMTALADAYYAAWSRCKIEHGGKPPRALRRCAQKEHRGLLWIAPMILQMRIIVLSAAGYARPMKCSMMTLLSWVTATAKLAALASMFGTSFAADSRLTGAWQLDPGQPGQAGLSLFTPTRYSMMLASTGRPDIADTSKGTAYELRALWGPLLANAGTYEISGDLMTIHPVVAKFPVVMKSGATEVYRFHVEGKTLTLQQVQNARGIAVAQAPTFKFVRVE